MHHISEKGSTFSKTIIALVSVGILSLYGIYLLQKTINEAVADTIINGVWEEASHIKTKIDDTETTEDNDHALITDNKIERKGFVFVAIRDSTPQLIKIETERKEISSGACKALKKKFSEVMWKDVFKRVMIIDKFGEERTDILTYNCPRDKIRALRFYVTFAEKDEPAVQSKPEETEEKEEVKSESNSNSSLPLDAPTPISNQTSESVHVAPPPSRLENSKISCPPGTSPNGAGSSATAGCRCNSAQEIWNGNNCEVKACPLGSSRDSSSSGDYTNIPGCRCNQETPTWSGKNCVKECQGDRVMSTEIGECVCLEGTIPQKNDPNKCVECNETTDCSSGYVCVMNECISEEENKESDHCNWGVCQSCDENNIRRNIIVPQECEISGLRGMCNNNGTCYPIEGKRCSSVRACPEGMFCNYGGNFNSSKKQKGKFGQTSNVCQMVYAKKFEYKGTTYYYNTKKDLKSWCRAANNEANCLWGYLAKSGAESWCLSLGKRLLTREEMNEVWSELKKELPQTYTGYAYWIQEGVWLEDFKGKHSFGKGHPDGYGGRGGVVCR